MASVIGESCLGERYGQCLSACPVDAIYPGTYKGEVFMVIDPDVCISCGACKPQCPVDAIFDNEDEAGEWAALNKKLAAEFKNNPKLADSDIRPANDPPKKPNHKLR